MSIALESVGADRPSLRREAMRLPVRQHPGIANDLPEGFGLAEASERVAQTWEPSQ